MVAARFAGLSVAGTMSWFALFTLGAGTWLTATTQTTLAYAASHRLFDKAAKAKMLWCAGGRPGSLHAFVAPLSLHECLFGYALGRSVLYVVYQLMSHHCARNGQARIRSAGKPAGRR